MEDFDTEKYIQEIKNKLRSLDIKTRDERSVKDAAYQHLEDIPKIDEIYLPRKIKIIDDIIKRLESKINKRTRKVIVQDPARKILLRECFDEEQEESDEENKKCIIQKKPLSTKKRTVLSRDLKRVCQGLEVAENLDKKLRAKENMKQKKKAILPANFELEKKEELENEIIEIPEFTSNNNLSNEYINSMFSQT